MDFKLWFVTFAHTEASSIDVLSPHCTYNFEGNLALSEQEITIKKAEWTQERNLAADIEAKKVLLVTYDVKNLTDKDYSVGYETDLYINGKKAEPYHIKVTLETISANRILENATQAFAVNEDGKLELEVRPFMSQKPKKIIKLNLN